jgi:hypothetical protein
LRLKDVMMEKARSRPRIGRNNPEILQPRPAESCEAKAAQLVIDWLLDDLNPKKPWDCLASWLSTIGNPCLAAKLMRADSANFLRRCPWVGEANKTQSVFPHCARKNTGDEGTTHQSQPDAHSRCSGKANFGGQSKKVRLSSHQWEKTECCQSGLSTLPKQHARSSWSKFFVKERNAVIPSPRCRF